MGDFPYTPLRIVTNVKDRDVGSVMNGRSRLASFRHQRHRGLGIFISVVMPGSESFGICPKHRIDETPFVAEESLISSTYWIILVGLTPST